MKCTVLLFLIALTSQTFAGSESGPVFQEDPLPLFASEVAEFSCMDNGPFGFELHYRHVRSKATGKILYSVATLKTMDQPATSYSTFDFFNHDRELALPGTPASIQLSTLNRELIFQVTKQNAEIPLLKMWVHRPPRETLQGKNGFQKAWGLVHLGHIPYQVTCTSKRTK